MHLHYILTNITTEHMKKVYQQPTTEAIKMEPSSILCASLIIVDEFGTGGGF